MVRAGRGVAGTAVPQRRTLRTHAPQRLWRWGRVQFNDTYVFLQRGPAHEDGPAGEVLDLAETGVGQFAIVVDDVDAVHAELAERGVAVISGPADRDWGMRTMTFADPGGTTWEIAQELPSVPGLS